MENTELDLRAEHLRYTKLVAELRREFEQAGRKLKQGEAVLAGYEAAVNGTPAQADAGSITTKDVLAIFADASVGEVSKPDMRELLASAGHDTRSAAFISRLNTILRRQRELKTLSRRIENGVGHYRRGPSYPV
jgi:hypothetical protein